MFFSMCLVVTKAIAVFSIFVNLILIALISYRSSRELGTYSWLLLSYTLAGLLFSVITLIGLPIFGPSEYGWILYASSVNVPQNVGWWIVVLYCFCYIALLLIITLSFIYRYFSICRRDSLIWFKERKRLLFVIFVSGVVSLVWTGLTVVYLSPSEELNQIFAGSVYNSTRLEIKEVSYIAGVAFKNGSLVLSFFFIFVFRVTVISSSMTIIIFCLIRILVTLRYVKYGCTENRKSGNTQRKLFILLVIQTIVPLTLVYIPAVSSYIIAFGRINAPDLSIFYTVLMPLAQLIDPLMIIILVPDYRRSAKAILSRIIGRCHYKLHQRVQDCYTITRAT